MNICFGDIIRMGSFVHVEPNARLTFKPKDKSTVAVFMYLGSENKDGAKPLDIEKRLNELGWFATPFPSKER